MWVRVKVSKKRNLAIETHIIKDGGVYKKINTQLAPPIKKASPKDFFVPKNLISTIIEATNIVGSSLNVEMPKFIISYLDVYY